MTYHISGSGELLLQPIRGSAYEDCLSNSKPPTSTTNEPLNQRNSFFFSHVFPSFNVWGPFLTSQPPGACCHPGYAHDLTRCLHHDVNDLRIKLIMNLPMKCNIRCTHGYDIPWIYWLLVCISANLLTTYLWWKTSCTSWESTFFRGFATSLP